MDLDLNIARIRVRIIDADAHTIAISKKNQAENDGRLPELFISASPDDISKVEAEDPSIPLGREMAKSFALLENLDMAMLEKDAFYLHASSVAVDGRAYLFSAKAGTGKSTHVSLWKKHFGSDAAIINGDRPFLRKIDGVFHAFGSPWAGKEGWSVNDGFPIAGLCFIERGQENSIERIGHADVIDKIFRQLRLPHEMDKMEKLLSLLDEFLNKVPCYRLYCNISDEAVMVSYKGMGGERTL